MHISYTDLTPGAQYHIVDQIQAIQVRILISPIAKRNGNDNK